MFELDEGSFKGFGSCCYFTANGKENQLILVFSFMQGRNFSFLAGSALCDDYTKIIVHGTWDSDDSTLNGVILSTLQEWSHNKLPMEKMNTMINQIRKHINRPEVTL